MAEEVAESVALGEGESDVASFVVEGSLGEDFVRDLLLLVAKEGYAGGESSGGDEPDAGEDEEDAGGAGHG